MTSTMICWLLDRRIGFVWPSDFWLADGCGGKTAIAFRFESSR
jgi:hypothetical protein